MVYLNRIYTKTGDDGTTGLGDGTRVPKTHPRIVSYGGVDELNSSLGVVLSGELPGWMSERLTRIQNDLYDLGADLCVPESGSAPETPRLRISADQVVRLEGWIDEANERLTPLTSFVLPAGTAAAAHLHMARTICRRVEIDVLHLAEFETINPQTHVYLNRLSDLLFDLARVANADGTKDVLWVPGANRGA
ncbi:MAG: cob(I)yrinic acid a,c-diamide adenosyltransferase [Planctomycetaceae bacterium]|nr:cob(I)yrinic acid a,c-diamide adenosyltransferase [Planctomycetaceae bacterium]